MNEDVNQPEQASPVEADAANEFADCQETRRLKADGLVASNVLPLPEAA